MIKYIINNVTITEGTILITEGDVIEYKYVEEYGGGKLRYHAATPLGYSAEDLMKIFY